MLVFSFSAPLREEGQDLLLTPPDEGLAAALGGKPPPEVTIGAQRKTPPTAALGAPPPRIVLQTPPVIAHVPNEGVRLDAALGVPPPRKFTVGPLKKVPTAALGAPPRATMEPQRKLLPAPIVVSPPRRLGEAAGGAEVKVVRPVPFVDNVAPPRAKNQNNPNLEELGAVGGVRAAAPDPLVDMVKEVVSLLRTWFEAR